MSERSQRVERIPRLQSGEQTGARADCLEDESAGVVLGPRDAEGTAEQRCRAPATSQLRKGSRHRSRGEMRQPHDQLEEAAPEPFHDEHLTGLEGRPAEIRGHETA